MNPYDRAYELKRALEECQEVKDYRLSYEKVNASPTNKKMLGDFRKQQIELQAQQLSGREPDKAALDQLEKLFNVLSLNPDINSYLQCEYKFSVLMNDISNIISEAIDFGFDSESEQ